MHSSSPLQWLCKALWKKLREFKNTVLRKTVQVQLKKEIRWKNVDKMWYHAGIYTYTEIHTHSFQILTETVRLLHAISSLDLFILLHTRSVSLLGFSGSEHTHLKGRRKVYMLLSCMSQNAAIWSQFKNPEEFKPKFIPNCYGRSRVQGFFLHYMTWDYWEGGKNEESGHLQVRHHVWVHSELTEDRNVLSFKATVYILFSNISLQVKMPLPSAAFCKLALQNPFCQADRSTHQIQTPQNTIYRLNIDLIGCFRIKLFKYTNW